MRLALLPVWATAVLTACTPSADLPSEADIGTERGMALFAQNCTSCHGPKARGNSAPDLTTLSMRAGGVFPAEHVMATIDGLDRHGKPGAVMPEFGARGLGDTVIVEHDGLGTPVPADLLALTTYIETIQR